ncbi:hypothetical protein OH76DRAFT_746349 [Lentinus brumalis]|uniref:Uncharacterized protein n=1 Tax=Lentinus brumalis TaxID=2498619 RepID=A0A371DSL2_9APHY|nr:hypothetical protein OH76DRAFT_746349 [Polyporus brumalis]
MRGRRTANRGRRRGERRESRSRTMAGRMGGFCATRTELAYVSMFPTPHRPCLLCARARSLGDAAGAGSRTAKTRASGMDCDGGREGGCLFGASQPRFKQLHTESKCEKTRENKFAPRKQTNTHTNSPQPGHRPCLSSATTSSCALASRLRVFGHSGAEIAAPRTVGCQSDCYRGHLVASSAWISSSTCARLLFLCPSYLQCSEMLALLAPVASMTISALSQQVIHVPRLGSSVERPVCEIEPSASSRISNGDSSFALAVLVNKVHADRSPI